MISYEHMARSNLRNAADAISAPRDGASPAEAVGLPVKELEEWV